MTDARAREVGYLEQIRIYPVRSLAGTVVAAVDVGPAGLAGDRSFTVVGTDGKVVRAKDAPDLRSLAASGDPVADAARLTALLGRPVRLAESRLDDGAVAPVHLVSRQALERAAAGQVPDGCSADDPRANLLVLLSGDEDERTWTGGLLRVGAAVLEVTRRPKHCLGIYADVRQPGRVVVGDPVLLSLSEPA